ncbi:MAG: hypothetical protein AAB474_01445 [Patescibacteria group bacterium]
MWLLEIIPITKSLAGSDCLTYFSTKELAPGALVEVFLRKKTVPALVAKTEKLEAKKAFLKKSSFSLKKINKVLAAEFLAADFISFINKTSEYFLTPPGSLAKFFLPQVFWKKGAPAISALNADKGRNLKPTSDSNAGLYKISAYQALRADRLKYFRGIIRETLSRGRSAAILTPTINAARDLFSEIAKGTEEKTFLLHAELPQKIFLDAWKQINFSEHPVVVVGTAPIMAALRPDTGVFIIEEDSNENYYNAIRRPFFDLRKAAEFLCAAKRMHLIHADVVLRLGIDESHILSYSNSRLLSQAENRIIDARKNPDGGFKILSPELIDNLAAISKNKESAVLIGHRRGFSSMTVCQDCGRIITCANCSSPLSLHKKNSKEPLQSYFLCHYCMRRKDAVQRCPDCKSWKLASYGIGIEKICEELRRVFPSINIFRLDSDTVKSRNEGEKIRNDFLEKGGVLAATAELFLNLFRNPVPHIAVAAIDGLFSLPDYRMHERIMIFLIRLRTLAQKSFLVQTRLAEYSIFQQAIAGNISGFKNKELEERKRFGYPPAVDMVKISLEDKNKSKLIARISTLARELQKWSPVDFPAFVVKIRGRCRWHIILRLPRASWPKNQPELHKILKNLSPEWSIQVDPPSLL